MKLVLICILPSRFSQSQHAMRDLPDVVPNSCTHIAESSHWPLEGAHSNEYIRGYLIDSKSSLTCLPALRLFAVLLLHANIDHVKAVVTQAVFPLLSLGKVIGGLGEGHG